MRRKGPDLLGLVALKRQKAEQAVSIVQAGMNRCRADIEALQATLRATDTQVSDFAALSLSLRQGHAQAVLANIRAKEAELKRLAGQLETARHELRRVLSSEDQLSRELRSR